MGSYLLYSIGILLASGFASGANQTFPISSNFTGIALSLPLYGQVNVSTSSNYSIVISAEANLLNDTSVTVVNGILQIAPKNTSQVTVNYNSPQIFNLTAPASALNSVYVSDGTLLVDGATVNSSSPLNATASGQAEVWIANATANGLNASATGQAMLTATGNYGSVGASLAGQSNVYISGNLTSVYATTSGQSSLTLSSPGLPQITGSSSGQSQVDYDNGQCSITGCSQQNSISPPSTIDLYADTMGTITIGGGSLTTSSSSGSTSGSYNPNVDTGDGDTGNSDDDDMDDDFAGGATATARPPNSG